MVTVNTELLRLYWDVGQLIVARQAQEGWGSEAFRGWPSISMPSFPNLKVFLEEIWTAWSRFTVPFQIYFQFRHQRWRN